MCSPSWEKEGNDPSILNRENASGDGLLMFSSSNGGVPVVVAPTAVVASPLFLLKPEHLSISLKGSMSRRGRTELYINQLHSPIHEMVMGLTENRNSSERKMDNQQPEPGVCLVCKVIHIWAFKHPFSKK